MDFQNKRETLNEEQGGYESYRSDGATRTKANDTKRHEAELALERDIVMTEYKTDRDVILKAIKESIKRRDYDDAQAFIHKYRFAAKTDDDFSILAKLLAQKLETQQKIEKIQTVIDATDDNDTTALIALNERILRIDPDHQRNRQQQEVEEKKTESLRRRRSPRSQLHISARSHHYAHVGDCVLRVLGVGYVSGECKCRHFSDDHRIGHDGDLWLPLYSIQQKHP